MLIARHFRDDVDVLLRPRDVQLHVDVDGAADGDRDLGVPWIEPRQIGGHLVGARGQVSEDVPASGVGGQFARSSGPDRLGGDGHAGQDPAGGVGDDAGNPAGLGLCRGGRREREKHRQRRDGSQPARRMSENCEHRIPPETVD